MDDLTKNLNPAEVAEIHNADLIGLGISDPKTLSRLVGIAESVVKLGCEGFRDLFGPSFKVWGGIAGDYFKWVQFRNQLRMAAKYRKICEERNLDTKLVPPPGFLIPAMRQVGDVSDDSLQEMWANLLLSASQRQEAQHPAFINILKDMTPNEAEVLLICGEHSLLIRGGSKGSGEFVYTDPEIAVCFMRLQSVGLLHNMHNFFQSWANLIRREAAEIRMGSPPPLTEFGMRLYAACAGKDIPSPVWKGP